MLLSISNDLDLYVTIYSVVVNCPEYKFPTLTVNNASGLRTSPLASGQTDQYLQNYQHGKNEKIASMGKMAEISNLKQYPE